MNQLEGNLLQPVVMGKALSVHPLVILLALTAGTILAGIIGAILSVPLTAVAWAAIKAWNSAEPVTPAAIAEAEHETELNEKGEGVRSKPRGERTPAEERSDTADVDADHG